MLGGWWVVPWAALTAIPCGVAKPTVIGVFTPAPGVCPSTYNRMKPVGFLRGFQVFL